MNSDTPNRRTKKGRRLVYIVIAAIISLTIVYALLGSSRLFERPTHGHCSKQLTRAILDRSLELGTQFLLNHQKFEGNFTYQYDWMQKTFTPVDNQVRQAGAMWGLALIYSHQSDPKVGLALEKAMNFFAQHSKTTPDGRRYVVYPEKNVGKTGTVALCALAYIDYLRVARSAIPEETFQKYRHYLDGYLEFLVGAQTQEGLWHQYYRLSDGQPFGSASPYYDGQSLLALVKAAKYIERDDLWSIIITAADAGYRYNIQEALQQNADSGITKGYYQWSSMAFFEFAITGWQGAEKYGYYVIDLADWMIDIHKTLKRWRNTGYAYEGIIHAYQLAIQHNDTQHVKKFACVIDTGLEKLTSLQVGSPLANWFTRYGNAIDDPLAIGGVQNHSLEAHLRIDVVQHQMHAIILALRYVYK